MSKLRKPNKSLDRLLKYAALHTGPGFFVTFANLRYRLRGLPSRIVRRGQHYAVVGDFREVEFSARRLAFHAFAGGLAARGAGLGSQYMLDQITFRPGDQIVDCGANIGDLKLYFDVKGIPISYLGIEPSPVEFEHLTKNVAPHPTLRVALWKAPGSMTFWVNSETADSSLIEIGEFTERIEVECRTLEDVLASVAHIRLLKLEAEGAEPEIIEGAGSSLSKIDYIAVDSGPERGVEQVETTTEVINLLTSRGFRLIGIRHRRICLLFERKDLA